MRPSVGWHRLWVMEPDTGFSTYDVAQFARDGFVIARGLTPANECELLLARARRDLAAFREPVEFEADTHYPGAPASRDAPGGRTIRRLLQAYARDPAYAGWVTGQPITRRIQQLLGSQACLSQAHHNCVMTKDPAFSSLTNWHRDIRYWAFQRPELVSIWLALGEERVDNGCLLLLPGSHRIEFAPHRLDAAQFLRADLEENQSLLQQKVTVELHAGDVLFFHCRAFHAAGSNRTSDTKFSLVFTCHAADNAPLPGTRSASLPSIGL